MLREIAASLGCRTIVQNSRRLWNLSTSVTRLSHSGVTVERRPAAAVEAVTGLRLSTRAHPASRRRNTIRRWCAWRPRVARTAPAWSVHVPVLRATFLPEAYVHATVVRHAHVARKRPTWRFGRRVWDLVLHRLGNLRQRPTRSSLTAQGSGSPIPCVDLPAASAASIRWSRGDISRRAHRRFRRRVATPIQERTASRGAPASCVVGVMLDRGQHEPIL